MGIFDLPVADGLAWIILGCILMTAEILAPGFFLIWIGGAALVTGLATLVLPIGSAAQLAVFAVSAVSSVYVARRWFASNKIESDDPLLNDRSGRLIGEFVTVIESVDATQGRVKVGDGVWSARGSAAAPGERLRVRAVENGVLIVEHA
jgi:inner membrane protein